MPSHSYPIVGSYFRPPAKLILENLPFGHPLIVRAEPTNEFDPNAIAIWVTGASIAEIPTDILEENLPNFGFDLNQVISTDEWHLGYIPKALAAVLKAERVIVDDKDIPGTVGFSPNGSARIIFQSEL